MSFVHLHNHTTFSMLDGAQKLKPMIAQAVADGQPAIATTDHGNVYSLIDFYKECEKQGIKPILGTEAYMARNSVDERPKPKKKDAAEDGETDGGTKLYHHLTVLAENNVGYGNLIKLSSRAYLEGFWRKARVDWDMLSDHSEGLIVTTGCLGGVVLQELLQGRKQEALEAAARLQEIFGKDNLLVELQDHGIPEQMQTNPALMEIATKIGAPLVVTNDAHYVKQTDAHAHDVLLCCNTGAKLTDKDRFKFHGDQHYLKSAREMGLLFPDHPEAIDNTLWVGERCDVKIEFGQSLLPHFPIPEGYTTEEEYLRHLVLEGAQQRWSLTDEVVDRLDYELDVICGMGMEGYFLVLWDLVRHAHKVGIRTGPARGSAGGCAIAYALRITDIDPIRWNLVFERFLNPARVSMPDIDLDIPARFRDHMINYTRQKYGDDRVCQIITFTQIGSRTAVRDAARVLDKPYNVGDRIAKALPPLVYGRDTPLHACMEKEEGLEEGYERADRVRAMYKNDPEAREVVDVAIGIEGLHRQDGIHAAAVVIAPGPLTDYVPVQRKPLKSKKEGPLVTQYDMNAVEELGLLKMDFLGLKTLDIISDTIDMIKTRHGIELDLVELGFDDLETFELLRRGETIGVFQLESEPMQELLRRLHPESFDDIAAVLALYRPGPMAANMHNDYADRKNGLQDPEVFHPDAQELLEETYGLCIYQEQVMAIAQKFAGYSLGDGYLLIKACAKKLPAAMEEQRSRFIPGCVSSGYSEEFAEELFALVEGFSDYGFNKSHSYGYGLISYWTAYLKANYPIEFMAACLITASEQERLGIVINDARRMGIEVLPPDVNVSRVNFAPVSENAISFGLTAIRGLGQQVSDDIVVEREAHGPFKDFFDYISRATKRSLNVKVVEALAQSGAFAHLGHTRQGLNIILKDVLKQEIKDRNNAGNLTLFEAPTEIQNQGVPEVEYDHPQLLELEREFLGVWLTGHPLEDVADEVAAHSQIAIADLIALDETEWRPCTVAGIVVNVKEITTRKGDLMKRLDIQDTTGSVSCVLFPGQTQAYGHILNHGDIVALDVKLQDNRGLGIELIVEHATLIKKGTSTGNNTIHLFAPDAYPVDRLKYDISQTKGDSEVVMHWLGQSSKLGFKSTIEEVKKVLQG
jgi:DNA polymerase-3 subunit alpha